MNTHRLDPTVTKQWDDREIGASEEYVAVAPESDSLELDTALAMKLVSIRLPIPLIDALKAIASHHGIAYQPMIRDLLTRFARSEVQQIVSDLDQGMRDAQSSDESVAPVQAFMDRSKVAACG